MLSRDIWNIIKKYTDISLENLTRIKNNTKCIKFFEYNSIMDLIVKAYKLGFTGFYIDKTMNYIWNTSKKLVDNKVIQIYENDEAIWFYIYMGDDRLTINIMALLYYENKV